MNRRAYTKELISVYKAIPEEKRDEFLQIFVEREKNPVVAFGWGIFLGVLGIDRFYVGHIFLGILKLLTAGGFGIWVIVDWFLIGSAARDVNIETADSIKRSLSR